MYKSMYDWRESTNPLLWGYLQTANASFLETHLLINAQQMPGEMDMRTNNHINKVTSSKNYYPTTLTKNNQKWEVYV